MGTAIVHFAHKPGARMFVGLSLLLTGLDDLVESVVGSEGLFDIDVFHGVTLFGFQKVMHSVGLMLEGVQESGHHALGLKLPPGHQVLDPGNPGQVVVDDRHHQGHQ
jgi:hypothetical protein